MSRKGIAGPIFFSSTITGDDIIQQFVSQLEKSEHRSWLQQDNGHPYVSTNTKSFLREFFHERLISTNLWSPRSPDFSLLDSLRNLEELKGNITWEIENIDQKSLKYVFLNLMQLYRICKANSGGHFQHLL